jgi:predicted RNase H-like nuclease (RuvC/YqgF family)
LLSVLAVLALLAAGVAIALQMQERTRRLAKERELLMAKAENEDLQQRLTDTRSAKERLEGELTRTKDELVQNLQQLEEERKTKETLAKSVDERQREIDRLAKELEQFRAERLSLTQQVAQLQQERDGLQGKVGDLEEAKAELDTKVTELSQHPSVELDRVMVSGSGSPLISSGAGLQGQVLVVNRDYDFIVMNLGRNHGLNIGQEFQVIRGSDVLARVKVEKVYDELSAAAILPDSNKEAIREGDAVNAI